MHITTLSERLVNIVSSEVNDFLLETSEDSTSVFDKNTPTKPSQGAPWGASACSSPDRYERLGVNRERIKVRFIALLSIAVILQQRC